METEEVPVQVLSGVPSVEVRVKVAPVSLTRVLVPPLG